MVIPGHNLGNSQVSVNRTIGPTLVLITFPSDKGHLIPMACNLVRHISILTVFIHVYTSNHIIGVLGYAMYCDFYSPTKVTS